MNSKKCEKLLPSEEKIWKLFDWKNEAAYPQDGKTGLAQWKWEFLRRRPGYLQDWLTYAPQAYEQARKEYEEKSLNQFKCGKKTFCKKKEEPLPPDHLKWTADMPRCLEKYGIPWLINPHDPHPETLWVFVYARPPLPDGKWTGDDCETDVFGRKLYLSKTEVALPFDLSFIPIEQQMAEIIKMFPFEMPLCDLPPETRTFHTFSEFLLYPNEEELEYSGQSVNKKLKINYKKHEPLIFPRPGHKNHYVAVLNLAFTFEYQWRFVKKKFQALQKSKAMQKRRVNENTWRKFLQVLDARASKVKFQEIGEHFYHKKKLIYNDYIARAQKDYKYATRIRDNFPF